MSLVTVCSSDENGSTALQHERPSITRRLTAVPAAVVASNVRNAARNVDMSPRLGGRDTDSTPLGLGSSEDTVGEARKLSSGRIASRAATVVEQLPSFWTARIPVDAVAVAVCAHDHFQRIQLLLRTSVPRRPQSAAEFEVRRRGLCQPEETVSLLEWREVCETLSESFPASDVGGCDAQSYDVSHGRVDEHFGIVTVCPNQWSASCLHEGWQLGASSGAPLTHVSHVSVAVHVRALGKAVHHILQGATHYHATMISYLVFVRRYPLVGGGVPGTHQRLKRSATE